MLGWGRSGLFSPVHGHVTNASPSQLHATALVSAIPVPAFQVGNLKLDPSWHHDEPVATSKKKSMMIGVYKL